jgi:hypothetical protein
MTMVIVSAFWLEGCHLELGQLGPPFGGSHKGQASASRSRTAARHAPKAAAPEADSVNTVAEEPSREPPKEPSDEKETSVVGMDAKQVRAALGPPTSRENRGPGETWRYRDGKCVASLRLFPDVETRDYHILAYEVTHDDNTADGRRLCMGEFRNRLRAKQLDARGE